MHDVLILGAGVSGLTLAWRLEQAGRRIAVYEGRDRIGGRTHAMEHRGQFFDLGATWLWHSEEAVLRLVDELGIGLFSSYDDGIDLFQTPLDAEWVRIPRSPIPEYRVAGGTGEICRVLRSRISGEVHLGRVARRIVASADSVVVEFDDEKVEAQTVVVAFPPSLLGASVEVVGLPRDVSKLYQHTPVWMGEMAKVVVVYDTPFWRESGFSGRVFSQVGPMVEMHDLSAPEVHAGAALFGFVPRSRAVNGWREAVLEQLIALFGEDARTPQRLEILAWWEDPLTQEVPSALPSPEARPNGGMQLLGHPGLRRPQLGGRLHLASTETAEHGAGHIEGAVHRAEELARLLTT